MESSSLPSQCLVHPDLLGEIASVEERYKVISYADDLKPAVTSIQEILLVDIASGLFEAASGCRLHVTQPLRSASFSHLENGSQI